MAKRAGGPYRQSIAGCLAGAIGSAWPRARPLLATAGSTSSRRRSPLSGRLSHRALPLLNIPEETADIDAAEAALARSRQGARAIIFFGTGGSGLGGQTLAQLGGWNIPGVADDAPTTVRARASTTTSTPRTLEAALGTLDLATTRFVVTSKSGGTTETLVQAIAAISPSRRRASRPASPSCSSASPSRACPARPTVCATCSSLGMPMLEHHTGIGGRFSC